VASAIFLLAAIILHVKFYFSVTHLIFMLLKNDEIATVGEPGYGPIFGRESDIQIYDKTIFSNNHNCLSSYERVEVNGISHRELLLGGREDDLEEYKVFKVEFE
jgi:hypothetical protein